MKEVADVLEVSTRMIAFHKYTIMEHLGVKTAPSWCNGPSRMECRKSTHELTRATC